MKFLKILLLFLGSILGALFVAALWPLVGWLIFVFTYTDGGSKSVVANAILWIFTALTPFGPIDAVSWQTGWQLTPDHDFNTQVYLALDYFLIFFITGCIYLGLKKKLITKLFIIFIMVILALHGTLFLGALVINSLAEAKSGNEFAQAEKSISIAKAAALEGSPALCADIRDQIYKDHCYLLVAHRHNNISACSNILSIDYKEYCTRFDVSTADLSRTFVASWPISSYRGDFDAITFTYKFISESENADSLLTVFLDDQMIYEVKESQVRKNFRMMPSVKLGKTYEGYKYHLISFRLVPLTQEKSEITDIAVAGASSGG